MLCFYCWSQITQVWDQFHNPHSLTSEANCASPNVTPWISPTSYQGFHDLLFKRLATVINRTQGRISLFFPTYYKWYCRWYRCQIHPVWKRTRYMGRDTELPSLSLSQQISFLIFKKETHFYFLLRFGLSSVVSGLLCFASAAVFTCLTSNGNWEVVRITTSKIKEGVTYSQYKNGLQTT